MGLPRRGVSNLEALRELGCGPPEKERGRRKGQAHLLSRCPDEHTRALDQTDAKRVKRLFDTRRPVCEAGASIGSNHEGGGCQRARQRGGRTIVPRAARRLTRPLAVPRPKGTAASGGIEPTSGPQRPSCHLGYTPIVRVAGKPLLADLDHRPEAYVEGRLLGVE
jgi:hypothetical protein